MAVDKSVELLALFAKRTFVRGAGEIIGKVVGIENGVNSIAVALGCG